MKMNRKIDLLKIDARETLDTLIELTDKPYLNTGDVRKLETSLEVIGKGIAGLKEYKALIATRLAERPPYSNPLKGLPVNSKNIEPVPLDV